MSFGQRLLEIRKSKNISQEMLADRIGVTRQTISNWEMNITVPNVSDLRNIVKELQVDYNELLADYPEKGETSNNINEPVKLIIKIFKIIGIIIVLGIVTTISLFIILKVKFDNENVKGTKSITCYYNESAYTYNFDYNKKNIVVNSEINGQISPDDSDVQWVNDIDNYVFSKRIKDPDTLILHIINEFELHDGYCD